MAEDGSCVIGGVDTRGRTKVRTGARQGPEGQRRRTRTGAPERAYLPRTLPRDQRHLLLRRRDGRCVWACSPDVMLDRDAQASAPPHRVPRGRLGLRRPRLADSRVEHARVFWVGNLASPDRAAFFVGWAQRSRRWALAGGMLTCTASMVGFFGPGGAWGPVSFAFVISWLLAGRWPVSPMACSRVWGRSRALLDGLALALPFVLEPWAWSLSLGSVQGPVLIWYVETAVGVALLVWVVVEAGDTRRTPRERDAERQRVGRGSSASAWADPGPQVETCLREDRRPKQRRPAR